MAEPTDKINLSNPTEVARETLRRLAMRRISPTPDNYQTLYEEIVGVPTAPANKASAETALAGLVSDLQEHHPALSAQVASLSKAIGKSDWRQCSWQLSEIAVQLRPQPVRPADSGDQTQSPLESIKAEVLRRHAISVQKRKLIGQGFGWAKTVGPIRQVMMRGLKKVDQMFVLTMRPTTSHACARQGKSVRRQREGVGNVGKWGSKGRKRTQRERKFHDASEPNEMSNF